MSIFSRVAALAAVLTVCAFCTPSVKAQAEDNLSKIAGAKGYEVIYDLELGKLVADNIPYDVDNSAKFTKAFDRVGYLVELGSKTDVKYVFVSVEAFTDDIKKIGVPSFSTNANFQQLFTSMDVYSNSKDITCGTGLKGNIEFWPNDYAPANTKSVPNASDAVYDFGDVQAAAPVDGYGSMQIHNYEAKQTLFAINHWRTGATADLGIGNKPDGNPDWTFSNNANTYEVKRLRVLVHPK